MPGGLRSNESHGADQGSTVMTYAKSAIPWIPGLCSQPGQYDGIIARILLLMMMMTMTMMPSSARSPAVAEK